MRTYHLACSFVFTLAAVISLGFALVFAGFDMSRDAAFCLILGLLCGLGGFCYRELSKPKNWSNSRG